MFFFLSFVHAYIFSRQDKAESAAKAAAEAKVASLSFSDAFPLASVHAVIRSSRTLTFSADAGGGTETSHRGRTSGLSQALKLTMLDYARLDWTGLDWTILDCTEQN